MEAVPAVELWGDPARIAQDQDAMRYVDCEPGVWFLLEQRGVFYREARYVINSMADDSALVRLDEIEFVSYRASDHGYLEDLTEDISNSGPLTGHTTYFQWNLYRAPEDAGYRNAVAAAVVHHTRMAEQRRQPRPQPRR